MKDVNHIRVIGKALRVAGQGEKRLVIDMMHDTGWLNESIDKRCHVMRRLVVSGRRKVQYVTRADHTRAS